MEDNVAVVNPVRKPQLSCSSRGSYSPVLREVRIVAALWTGCGAARESPASPGAAGDFE